MKLFADAQFYSCKSRLLVMRLILSVVVPRLISQLFESEIFIQIGDSHFQIPRDTFSGPGDSPNFFSLGFAVFFASPTEVFPGLNRDGLLRPPSIVPPSIPNRSGDVFAELLHILRGYPLHIRNEEHRAQLLRDCRYFHLRGLEQKLIPHDISFNPVRQRSEIVIRLEDVRPSGVQLASPDSDSSDAQSDGLVMYARPFVDDKACDLIVEIGNEATALDLDGMHAEFFDLTKSRASSLLQVAANKSNLPVSPTIEGMDDTKASISPLGRDRVKIQINEETDLTVDGEQAPFSAFTSTHTDTASEPPAKRKRFELEGTENWIVRTGQWRLQVQSSTKGTGFEVVLAAVKLDVYTKQRIRNKARRFLG